MKALLVKGEVSSRWRSISRFPSSRRRTAVFELRIRHSLLFSSPLPAITNGFLCRQFMHECHGWYGSSAAALLPLFQFTCTTSLLAVYPPSNWLAETAVSFSGSRWLIHEGGPPPIHRFPNPTIDRTRPRGMTETDDCSSIEAVSISNGPFLGLFLSDTRTPTHWPASPDRGSTHPRRADTRRDTQTTENHEVCEMCQLSWPRALAVGDAGISLATWF